MAGEYFLNANGGVRYTVMRYVDGRPAPTTPVIGPANDGGASGVAWVSAFRLQVPTSRIYGSRYVNNVWADIGIWEGSDPAALLFKGIALAANASEPFGIGPAQAFYVPGDARPWKMAYVVRESGSTSIGSSIWVADSIDGTAGSFQRVGSAIAVSEPWEACGIVPSYVFYDDESSKWVMLYHAYESMTLAHAACAMASSPGGPYGDKVKLMSPINSRIAITGASRGTCYASASSSPRIGEPYVLRQASPLAMEAIVPVDYRNGIVYFDRPLLGDYTSAEMAHVAARKIDPSYIEKAPDGTWRGAWTGYGQFDGVLSEYTLNMTAPALFGPWAPAPTGLAFAPWTSGGILSTENPTPVISVP